MESIARTLLVVTLALEDALARQDPHEADCLVRRRQELLDELGGRALTPDVGAILSTTAEVEKRMLANLAASQSAVSGRLRVFQQRKRAGKAYASAASFSRWEQSA